MLEGGSVKSGSKETRNGITGVKWNMHRDKPHQLESRPSRRKTNTSSKSKEVSSTAVVCWMYTERRRESTKESWSHRPKKHVNVVLIYEAVQPLDEKGS